MTILVSEEPVDPKLIDKTEHPGPLPEVVVAHLDKAISACTPIRRATRKVGCVLSGLT